MLKFVSCCEAAGPAADYGYYVNSDAPIPPRAGPVSEPIPERKFEPTLDVCLHEASHALHLHARGYRIARAQVGRRNFIERAPGEGAKMSSMEQIEAALAGDVGANYTLSRMIHRIGNDEIETALARVATGKHGSCDACIAGVFTRHIAEFSDAPDKLAVMREIWRRAECNVISLLTSRQAYFAVRSLGEMLRNENEMTGEAVHRIIDPYIEFGSQGSENDRQVN